MTATLLTAAAACSATPPDQSVISPESSSAPSATALPPGAVDYQLGGDYPPPDGVTTVVRQWSSGQAAPGVFSVCYVNAFQTEAEPDVPDSPESWPQQVVRYDLEDAAWPGEHPIDISTPALRQIAAGYVAGHFRDCAAKGFQATELDNLDTYTRYPTADVTRDDAIAYASLLVRSATEAGLIVGQKNSTDLLDVARSEIGFSFGVVEECGEFDECQAFVDTYGDQVLAIEYTETGFAAACTTIGNTAQVVLRDIGLSTPDNPAYVHRAC